MGTEDLERVEARELVRRIAVRAALLEDLADLLGELAVRMAAHTGSARTCWTSVQDLAEQLRDQAGFLRRLRSAGGR